MFNDGIAELIALLMRGQLQHQVEVLAELDSGNDSFRDDVYQGLRQRYPA